MIGVNISGAEFGTGIGGIHDRDYHYPTLSELEFYKSKGVDLVRLPFTWERMQPTIGGPLNPTELALLKGVLTNAASLGMDIIIDLHNYARYYGQTIGSATGPTQAQFADFWSKLANEIKGFTSLVGYDLMNEPHDMPSPDIWKNAAQAATDAIRKVDMDNTIFVEGNNWSGAWSWQMFNSNFIINDPANKIVYQAHQYFDKDSSGTYRGTYDQEGAYPMVGVDKLKPFVEWLKANNLKGMIGEVGAPSNDPRWLEVMKNSLDYMKANDLIVTAWGAGAWWPTDYSMFMGAPGRTDSAYLDLFEQYFTPWVEPGATAVAPAPIAATTPPSTSGTAGDDVIRGTALHDVVDAKEGNDTIFGSATGDLINGGLGTDAMNYSEAAGRVDVDLTRSAQFASDAEGDQLSGIENLIGSAFNDRLAGDGNANQLSGGAGDDLLVGRGGADRLDGGVGVDAASYEGSTAAVNIDLLRTSQQGGDAAGDVLVGIEAITGSGWDDILRGSNSADTLNGGAGNDLLEGRGGGDTLIGGEGVDTVSYANSAASVEVNLNWSVQKGGDAAGDKLSGVENIVGSRFGDRIAGNGSANVIDGGAGDDWLKGGWGSDTLIGGSGRDRFLFDSVGNARGDRVADFNPLDDRLVFSHIDANSLAGGNQGFTWIGTGGFTKSAGQMRTYVEAGSTFVAGDVNGDGIADFSVALTGSMTLSSSHIFL